MGAHVIDLTSRLAQAQRAETCPVCRPDFTCHPHRIADLSHRLHGMNAQNADELLIPREVLTDVLADVLDVLDQITAEVLPHERNAR